MSATAEVFEIAGAIECDSLSFPDDLIDELELVGIPSEEGAGFRLADLAAAEILPGLEDDAHFFLDCLEMFISDRGGEIEIIVKAIIDSRTDGELGIRIEPEDSSSQEMGK